MTSSQGTKRFILDDAALLTPCEDPQAWAEWMANPDNTDLIHTRIVAVGRCVRTVFTGENVGTEEHPVFFETVIEPIVARVNVVRDHNPPIIYARNAEWSRALLDHDKAISYARRMGT